MLLGSWESSQALSPAGVVVASAVYSVGEVRPWVGLLSQPSLGHKKVCFLSAQSI